MFGTGQKINHHAVSYDTFNIHTQLGKIAGHEFIMTDVFNTDSNKLYLLEFPNIDCVLKSSITNGNIVGSPRHSDIAGRGLMYVGINKQFVFHTAYLNKELQNAVLSYLSGRMVNPGLINMISQYPYNMKNFVLSNLNGRMQAFGYNKDMRQWDLVNQIQNQSAIGDIVNYRITTVKNAMAIIDKLNEKFPMGKKGLE